MPLPSSGEIKVSQINAELGRISSTANSNLAGGTTPQTGSLFKLGQAGGVNQTAPHALSEWYSYGLGLSDCLFTRTGQYTTNSYELCQVDLTAYRGDTIRLVWHYVSGSSYTGDIQIDTIKVTEGAGQADGFPNLTYDFDSSTESFQTSTTDTASYGSVSFSNLTTGTSTLRWNRDSGGTGSGGTGLTFADSGSFYVYAETSGSGYSNKNFWLRSPQIVVEDSERAKVEWKMARYGSTIGTLCFHVEVVSAASGGTITQFYIHNYRENNGQYRYGFDSSNDACNATATQIPTSYWYAVYVNNSSIINGETVYRESDNSDAHGWYNGWKAISGLPSVSGIFATHNLNRTHVSQPHIIASLESCLQGT